MSQAWICKLVSIKICKNILKSPLTFNRDFVLVKLIVIVVFVDFTKVNKDKNNSIVNLEKLYRGGYSSIVGRFDGLKGR